MTLEDVARDQGFTLIIAKSAWTEPEKYLTIHDAEAIAAGLRDKQYSVEVFGPGEW